MIEVPENLVITDLEQRILLDVSAWQSAGSKHALELRVLGGKGDRPP